MLAVVAAGRQVGRRERARGDGFTAPLASVLAAGYPMVDVHPLLRKSTHQPVTRIGKFPTDLLDEPAVAPMRAIGGRPGTTPALRRA